MTLSVDAWARPLDPGSASGVPLQSVHKLEGSRKPPARWAPGARRGEDRAGSAGRGGWSPDAGARSQGRRGSRVLVALRPAAGGWSWVLESGGRELARWIWVLGAWELARLLGCSVGVDHGVRALVRGRLLAGGWKIARCPHVQGPGALRWQGAIDRGIWGWEDGGVEVTDESRWLASMRELISRSKDQQLDEDALSVAHLAVEDTLIDMRDSRMFVLGRANGFVVNEADGQPSSVIRLGTRDGLRIAIQAYLEALA